MTHRQVMIQSLSRNVARWRSWREVAVDECLSALAAAGYEVVRSWQPVETMPVDGEEIQAISASGHQMIASPSVLRAAADGSPGIRFIAVAWRPTPVPPAASMPGGPDGQ